MNNYDPDDGEAQGGCFSALGCSAGCGGRATGSSKGMAMLRIECSLLSFLPIRTRSEKGKLLWISFGIWSSLQNQCGIFTAPKTGCFFKIPKEDLFAERASDLAGSVGLIDLG